MVDSILVGGSIGGTEFSVVDSILVGGSTESQELVVCIPPLRASFRRRNDFVDRTRRFERIVARTRLTLFEETAFKRRGNDVLRLPPPPLILRVVCSRIVRIKMVNRKERVSRRSKYGAISILLFQLNYTHTSHQQTPLGKHAKNTNAATSAPANDPYVVTCIPR